MTSNIGEVGKPDVCASSSDNQVNAQITNLETQLKQALADYQNLKRDMDKRLKFEGNLVRADVLRTVIGILNDVDLALSHKSNDDEKAWRDGIVMILQKMQTVVTQSGACKIECKAGDVFDPHFHEAVGVLNEGKDGTIAKIVENGYVLGDVLVKPARVVVYKNNISSSNNE